MNKLQELKEYIQKEIPEINNCPICGSKKGVFKCSRGARNCADCMQYVGEIKISLEDVLRLLGDKKTFPQVAIEQDGEFRLRIEAGKWDDTCIYWKFNKPLDQQSEETMEFLHKLLS